MKCKMYWRVAIKDVVGLKPKMHSYVVEDSSERKRTNRNE